MMWLKHLYIIAFVITEGRFIMEIERKYLIRQLPEDYTSYPHHKIEQKFINTNPVVRIRQEDDNYYLTYKSKGLMVREEYNLPLNPGGL